MIDKLGEELAELAVELGNPEDSLVDLREVINCLVDACGLSSEDFDKATEAKRIKYGSFKDRTFIEEVDIPEDNEWVYYLEQHPDKYPEITEKS